jgi:protein tyrosine/serine phosphatase
MKWFVFFQFSLISFLSFADPVDNFHIVTEGRVSRGARPINEEEVMALKAIGIQTVVNLQGGDFVNQLPGHTGDWFEKGEYPDEINAEKRMVADHGMGFVSAPLDSMMEIGADADLIADPKQILNNQYYVVREVMWILQSPQVYGNVFIHCAHGADRTGMIIALYRQLFDCWSAQDVLNEMKAHGHNFLHQLFTSEMSQAVTNNALLNRLRKDLQLPMCSALARAR